MTERARGTSATSETRRVSDTEEYAGWLTKQEAATAIRGSTKMVERLAADGQMQQASTQRQGRGAFRTVYHPDDVARIATVRRTGPAAFVLPAGVTSPVTGNGNGQHTPEVSMAHTRGVTPPGDDVLRLVFAAALRRVSETSETLFLTIPEAAARSGLSQANLRRRCQSGWPGALKDGAWKIRRKDLEAL